MVMDANGVVMDEVGRDRGAAVSLPADPAVLPAHVAAPGVPEPEPVVVLAPGTVVAAPVGFAEFYAARYTGLVRMATLMSGSVDAAPDLVQDCFVRLHARWASVSEPLP